MGNGINACGGYIITKDEDV